MRRWPRVGPTEDRRVPVLGSRRGSSLVESLVALLLTAGLLVLMSGFLIRHGRAARVLAERIEGVESARLARDLISSAVRSDPGARVGEGGLATRIFVAVAERCGDVAWRVRGRRLPEGGRDSLWVVAGSGRVSLAALSQSSGAECDSGEGARVVTMDATPPLGPEARLVRVFESGRYRVDDAVRYGRAGSGAQPLSAPVLDPRRSGVAPDGDGVVVRIVPEGRPDGFVGRWGR